MRHHNLKPLGSKVDRKFGVQLTCHRTPKRGRFTSEP